MNKIVAFLTVSAAVIGSVSVQGTNATGGTMTGGSMSGGTAGGVVNDREISGAAAGGMPVEAPVQALTQSGGVAQGGGTSLILIETRSPGSYIADTEGMTLYTLVDDDMQPLPCDVRCLSIFPALTGDVTLGGEGGTTLDASLLGTVEAADGSSQVTYNGYPLHYYTLDQNPGDLEAQSLTEFGGTWYVLAGNPPHEPLESDPVTGEDGD